MAHHIDLSVIVFARRGVCRLLRATALIGDALGHSWVGLLLLRAMDFRLQTPVPLAYAYKTMMFFVPASGSKNAIVIGEELECREGG